MSESTKVIPVIVPEAVAQWLQAEARRQQRSTRGQAAVILRDYVAAQLKTANTAADL